MGAPYPSNDNNVLSLVQNQHGKDATAVSEDLTGRGMRELTRIDLDEQWEVRYWAVKLNVTEDRLREAVKAVGASVQAVREYLLTH